LRSEMWGTHFLCWVQKVELRLVLSHISNAALDPQSISVDAVAAQCAKMDASHRSRFIVSIPIAVHFSD
ncbi:MAG: hypothetical protein WAL45_21620, partial [Terracidiphilus sp.]